MKNTRNLAELMQEADKLNSARISSLAASGASVQVLEEAFDNSYAYKAGYLEKNGVFCSPVKLGQTVWIAHYNKVDAYMVSSINLLRNRDRMELEFSAELIESGCEKKYLVCWDSHIGKSVFFTKEEAEAVLKKEVS